MNRYIEKIIKAKFYELLSKLGPQNWWPIQYNFSNPKIEVVLGAILTQNTSWRQVEKSLYNLSKENLINFNLINAIEENKEKIIELIRPSGFPKRKVETIYEALKWLKENENKKWDVNKLDKLRNELLKIKGIGKETADSIILYAFNLPIFIIDNYTRKFYYELSGKFIKDYDKLREIFENSFKEEKNKVYIFKEYHALIVEYQKLKRKNKK